MAETTQSPNGVADPKEITPPVITATNEDLAKLVAMNPLAAAQLEAIIWKRAYAELKAGIKERPSDA